MPSITGPIKINSVASGGTVKFGDALQITPKSTSKTFTVQGSLSTGDGYVIVNGANATNTFDPSGIDSSNVGNN